MKALLEKAVSVAALAILLISVLFTAFVWIFHNSLETNYDSTVIDLDEGWQTPDGDILTLEQLSAGDITISQELTALTVKNKSLCFKSMDTHFSVLFDGETAYSYAPVQPNILARSYGKYIHMIPIPEGASEVTLVLHPIYDGTAAYIADAAIEDPAMFIGNIYHEGLPGASMCALIALFGVLMLIIGFTNRRSDSAGSVDLFSLGAFAILIGVWSANDTYILQVFTQHPEIVRFVNYMCLIFVAYLPVSFMASATNHRKTILLPILLGLVAVNFVLTMTLAALGIRDVRQMLIFSHINIAIALVMTIYLMVRAVRKRTVAKQFMHTIIIGMSAAVLGVMADMIRYRVLPESLFGSSFFTRVGVLTFVILMGLHLIRERTRLAVEQGRAELMKKMAYTDGLTNLANRAAFHEKENEIRRSKSDCTIVQLDINFLKKVNDVYGHAEGDRHIINAAHIIRDCFADIGTCYRTGGDEFIVVAQKGGTEAVEKALAEMEKRAAEYNSAEAPPVPLQIAYGHAHYATQADMLEAAEKLADQRMYEKKRAMKGLGTA